MKRILCLIAAAVLALGLIGCDTNPVVKRDSRGNGNEGYRNGRGYRDGKDTDKYRSAAGGGGDAGKNQGCAG